MKQSNDLRYTATKTVGKEVITVKIRLNDECKNGHQDFSVTGDVYEAGKARIDRNMISCGCVHDYILKAFPEFKQFVNLHLCDYAGVPMHAVANGLYHIQQGFNNTKPDNPIFAAEYCEYYRITAAQYNDLSKSQNEVQFAMYLQSLGILAQWQAEATEAIAVLEKLTDSQFVNDSKKSQFIAPTPEEINEENQKQLNGYYTPEAEAAREEAKKDKLLQELTAEYNKDVTKATNEYEAKKQVLLHGGEKALKNIIYYTHTQTISFNWRSYDNLPEAWINEVIGKLQLPAGVKAEIAKGK